MTDRHSPTERLSGFLNGELDGTARREVEAHLEKCAECRAALAELRGVVEAAGALEDRPPAADLWPAIEARLEPRPGVLPLEPGRSGAPRGRPARRISFTLPQLAAAAVALALASAGAMRLTSAPSGGSPAAAAVDVRAADGSPGVRFASSGFPGDADYTAAVADLERMLEGSADRLDPATVAILERSLRVIDEAIREAYAALADDPSDPYLNHHLVGIRHRKLELLRRAVDLARAET